MTLCASARHFVQDANPERYNRIGAAADSAACDPSRTSARAHPGYLYGVGSITKMFVPCVIEQLIDEGRLNLEATGRELLGDAVVAGIPNADRATVRQLLDHTSGVPSWEFDSQWIRHGRGCQIRLIA